MTNNSTVELAYVIPRMLSIDELTTDSWWQLVASVEYIVAGYSGVATNAVLLYVFSFAEQGQFRLLVMQGVFDLVFCLEFALLGSLRTLLVFIGANDAQVPRWMCSVIPGGQLRITNIGCTVSTMSIAISRLLSVYKPVWFHANWKHVERKYISCVVGFIAVWMLVGYISLATGATELMPATCPKRHHLGVWYHFGGNYIKTGANVIGIGCTILAVSMAKKQLSTSDAEKRLNTSLVVLVSTNVVFILIPQLVTGLGTLPPVYNQVAFGIQVWNSTLNYPLYLIYIKDIRQLTKKAFKGGNKVHALKAQKSAGGITTEHKS